MPVNAVKRCPCSCGVVERDPKEITLGELADAVEELFREAGGSGDFVSAFFHSKNTEAQKTILAVCRLDADFAEVCGSLYNHLQNKYN